MTKNRLMKILSLKEEVKRNEYLPRLMNLFSRLNGFFDDCFESFWEEKTVFAMEGVGKALRNNLEITTL